MKIKELLEAQELTNNWKPKIGWWLDNDPVTFYHGTHKTRLEEILQNGLISPKTGHTAGWVSLALEPNTALGYASMHGGETTFRKAGAKAKHVPTEDRIVLVIKMPQGYFLPKMKIAGRIMTEQKKKLEDKNLYLKFKEEHQNWPDTVYYQLTEITMPEKIPAEFIVNWMKK